MTMPSNEWLQKEAESKIVKADIFTFDNPVITVKAGGKTYGALSTEADKRGIEIPNVEFGTARFADPYIFVALWDEESSYDDFHMVTCAGAILHRASVNNVKKVAVPLLGGKEAMSKLWMVEKGMFDQADFLESNGLYVPEYVYVTDKEVT